MITCYSHRGATMRRMLLLSVLGLGLFGLASSPAQEKVVRSETEQKALAKIRQLGGLALELAQNDPRLEVSYLQKEGKFTDDYLTPLKDLKGLVHVNLRSQDVTDEQMNHLAWLTSLTRLHLEKTKITDRGLEKIKG